MPVKMKPAFAMLIFIKVKMKNITVIKSTAQYHEYCDRLEKLTSRRHPSKQTEDEMELLTVLIEKYDTENAKSFDQDPVQSLLHLMEMHGLNAASLAEATKIHKTVLSKILNYKKSISKENIRILAAYFKVNQELFNKPYPVDDTRANQTKNSARKFEKRASDVKLSKSLRVNTAKR
jgi:HTH-type transcriptional regulator / antitoxin HigA